MTDIEFVGPSGTVELHGFRRGAREVVGEKVLARNLATNPSFEEASGEVVVRENLCPNPQGKDNLTGWNSGSGGSRAQYSLDGHPGVKVTGTGSYVAPAAGSYPTGSLISVSVLVAALNQDAVGKTVELQGHDGTGFFTTRVSVTLGLVGETVEAVCASVTTATSPRAYAYPIGFTGSEEWFITDALIQPVDSVGDSPGAYFDEDTVASDDRMYRPRTDGGAEEYVHSLAGFTDAYQSQEWAVSGTHSLRVPSAGTGYTLITLPGASSDTYTVLATARFADQAFGLGGGVVWSDTPGQQLRTTVAGGSLCLLSSVWNAEHSGPESDGWWDDLLIVEGDYTGPYFDKDTPAHGDVIYRREDDGTTSKVQLLYKPLPEWIFEDMIGWYDLTEDKVPVDERPQGHGAFNVAKSWRSSLAVSVKAHILGADGSNSDVIDEFERLGALGVDGPVEMRVTDSVRTTSRMVSIRNVEAEDEHGHDVGTINIDCVARDPRRYSVDDQWVTGSPLKPSGGLTWPAQWPLVWAGEQGSDGRITLTNQGKKFSSPVYRVYGGYDGFTLTNTGTQQRVGFHWTVPSGSYVELDFARRTATLDGQADVTRYLTIREWWDVAPGKSVTAQLEVDAPSLSPYFAGMVRSAW